MVRIRRAEPSRGNRLRMLIALALVVVGGIVGGYYFYAFRTRQNTQKLLQRAQRAAAEHDWEGASVAYRQYLRREPLDSAALGVYTDVLLAQLKTQPEKIGDAVRTLRRLAAVEPDNSAALAKLTQLYLGLGEYRVALGSAANWAALSPESPEASLALAQAQYGVGEPEQAVPTLIAAIGLNPNDPRLYPLLITILARDLERPVEAAKWLEKALEVGDNNPDVQLAAHQFYMTRGETNSAEKYLRRALTLAPRSVSTLLRAAAFYLSNGRLNDAEVMLNRAAEIAPNSRRILSARALWAKKQGDSDALIATADELTTQADDKDVGLLAEAAELYLRAGQFDRVDDCLAKVNSIARPSGELEARISVLQGARALGMGRPYLAIARLRPAVVFPRPTEWAIKLLALAYLEIGDLGAADEMYQRLLSLAPDDSYTLLTLADLAWRRGRYADARRFIDRLPAGAENGRAGLTALARLACDLGEAERKEASPEATQAWPQTLQQFIADPSLDLISARWLMRCLVLSGQPQQAVSVFRAMTSGAGEALKLGAELGRLLSAKGPPRHVLAVAEDLIHRFPGAVEGHLLRIVGLCSQGRLSEAEIYVDENDLDPEKRGVLLEALGDEYLAAEQTESALNAFRKAAESGPSNVSARRKLARRSSDREDALRWAQEIRAIEGEAGSTWRYELAGVLLRLDPSVESIAHSRELLEQCLADRPRWSSARLLLGYGYELSGALLEAAAAYQSAIAHQPTLTTKSTAIRLIGLLRRLGRFAEADAFLNSLATAVPEEPEVLQLRITQQLRQRDFDSALATAERLIELRPDDPAWVAGTSDLYLRVGKPAQAEAIARPALARFPHSVPILWSLAQALIAQGRGDEAESEVRTAVAAVGDAAHLMLFAHVLAQRGQLAKAEGVVANAVELDPEDATVWAACADFWGRHGERSRQVACARNAIELRGEDPTESLGLARLLASSEASDDLSEAGQIVRRCLATDPDDASALLIKVKLALVEGTPDLAGAEADLRRALGADPRSPEIHRLLAAVQARAGEFSAAAETVATGLAFAPTNTELLLSAGEIHCHRGEYPKAIEPLQRILALNPRSLRALRLLATALHETGQVERAVEILEGVAPVDAMTAGELLILARLHEIDDDLDRAEQFFLRALDRSRESGEVFREVVQFLLRRRDFEQVHALAARQRAERPEDVRSFMLAAGMLCAQSSEEKQRNAGMGWLDEISRTQPEYAAEAAFHSGMCYYQHGDLNAAESRLLQALRGVPAAPEPVNALGWLYAVDFNRPADARAVIDKFLATGGREHPALMDTHGLVLLRLGELEAAQKKLEECLRMVGQTSTKAAANYHLGLVLLESGRAPEALTHIRRGLLLSERLGGLTDQERAHAKRLVADVLPAGKPRNPGDGIRPSDGAANDPNGVFERSEMSTCASAASPGRLRPATTGQVRPTRTSP